MILALYEWWRWLFSIPPNPLLFTVVAAVALTHTWRRRKVYKAELNHLQPDRDDACPVGEVIGLLHSKAHHMREGLANQIAIQTISLSAQKVWRPFKGSCDVWLCVPLARHLLSALLSGLKRNTPWPNR